MSAIEERWSAAGIAYNAPNTRVRLGELSADDREQLTALHEEWQSVQEYIRTAAKAQGRDFFAADVPAAVWEHREQVYAALYGWAQRLRVQFDALVCVLDIERNRRHHGLSPLV